MESAVPNYQDTEDPDYEDFRAEARLQRSRQLESFAKAAEAYKQGRKEVASFYAQQVSDWAQHKAQHFIITVFECVACHCHLIK